MLAVLTPKKNKNKWEKGHKETFKSDVLITWTVVMIIQVYTYVYQSAYIKYVQSFVYQFYLNEAG